MSTYGELLKKYINKSGISVRKLAAECGIDRTLLQKYLSGSRFPKDMAEVRCISKCLMLPPDKRQTLVESYHRDCYGEKQYEEFLNIREILAGLRDFHFKQVMETEELLEISSPKPEEIYGRAFDGALQVEAVLAKLLLEQMQKQIRLKIRVLAQPDTGSLLKILLHLCSAKEVEVEQIVCLDKGMDGNTDNLKTIYNLLPLVFGGVHYHSFYYYDQQNAHINGMNLLPNLILAGDCVIVCNAEMDECMVFRDSDCVQFYGRQYEKIKAKTETLTGCPEEIDDLFSFMDRFITNENETIRLHIGAVPCYSCEPDTEIREGMTNIFSEEGLRNFMDTGCFCAYSSDGYRYAGKQERLEILERTVRRAENAAIDYLMTDPFYLKLDRELMIYIDSKIVFRYHQERCERQFFSINEISIRRAFLDFVKFAEKNHWVYNREETVIRMREILEEYKKKLG